MYIHRFYFFPFFSKIRCATLAFSRLVGHESRQINEQDEHIPRKLYNISIEDTNILFEQLIVSLLLLLLLFIIIFARQTHNLCTSYIPIPWMWCTYLLFRFKAMNFDGYSLSLSLSIRCCSCSWKRLYSPLSAISTYLIIIAKIARCHCLSNSIIITAYVCLYGM